MTVKRKFVMEKTDQTATRISKLLNRFWIVVGI